MPTFPTCFFGVTPSGDYDHYAAIHAVNRANGILQDSTQIWDADIPDLPRILANVVGPKICGFRVKEPTGDIETIANRKQISRNERKSARSANRQFSIVAAVCDKRDRHGNELPYIPRQKSELVGKPRQLPPKGAPPSPPATPPSPQDYLAAMLAKGAAIIAAKEKAAKEASEAAEAAELAAKKPRADAVLKDRTALMLRKQYPSWIELKEGPTAATLRVYVMQPSSDIMHPKAAETEYKRIKGVVKDMARKAKS
jgi:hypothetical protein